MILDFRFLKTLTQISLHNFSGTGGGLQLPTNGMLCMLCIILFQLISYNCNIDKENNKLWGLSCFICIKFIKKNHFFLFKSSQIIYIYDIIWQYNFKFFFKIKNQFGDILFF